MGESGADALTTGVLYQLLWMRPDREEQLSFRNGQSYSTEPSAAAELLVASILSLRLHYSGPVAILATEPCYEVARQIGSDDRLSADVYGVHIDTSDANPCYTAKIAGLLMSPFDQTIAVDIDVACCGVIDWLFGDSIAVAESCHVNDDLPMARGVRYALRQYAKLGAPVAQIVQEMRSNDAPLTNSGVISYPNTHPLLWSTYWQTMATRKHPKLTGEMALQMNLWRYRDSVTWLSPSLQCLLRYSDSAKGSVFVHGHGRRWCRTEAGRKVWHPLFYYAFENNLGGIESWGSQEVLTCEE